MKICGVPIRQSQIRLLCTAILFARVSLTAAAEPTPEKRAAPPAAAPLENIEFVEAKMLSMEGSVITPRDDSRVPRIMVDLLGEESIVRIYPWCSFEMADSHPVWKWETGLPSGVREKDSEALRLRFVDRLRKQGFSPLPDTPDSVPKIHRTGDRPLKYRKIEQGRELTVEFGGLMPWVGGRKPAIGVSVAFIIRGTTAITPPKLSEVIAAYPTISPPTHGKRTIPPEILETLQSLPVTRVMLSGTRTTWYALSIVTPDSSLKDFSLRERIEAQLVAAEFQKEDPPKTPRSKGAEAILQYGSSASGSTSNCRITMDKVGADCRINLFVQP